MQKGYVTSCVQGYVFSWREKKKSGKTEMAVKEWTEYYWHMPQLLTNKCSTPWLKSKNHITGMTKTTTSI